MISYLEGVLLRDSAGNACVVETSEQGAYTGVSPIPNMMHPFAARSIGHRYEELERAASVGSRVLMTIVNDPSPMILEIDEITPIDAVIAASAREVVGTRLVRTL